MKKSKLLALATLILKILIGLFLIDVVRVNEMFDFVASFKLGQSPWDQYYLKGQLHIFPYPALMLYIYKIVQLPLILWENAPQLIKNALYIAPLLIADLGSLKILNKMFPNKQFKTIFFFFLSPIVIYATYYLGHLDLIALLFMLLALYEIQKRDYVKVALSLALGFSIKIPMMFALPLVVVYIYRNDQKNHVKVIAKFVSVFIASVIVISIPFITSMSYLKMVYFNSQQSLLYDLILPMGQYHIYIAYLALLVIYARFLMYEKVNKDLFHNFLAVVYSVFVILVPPSENWYVWSVVLCSVLFISLLDRHKISYLLSSLLSIVYLICFMGDFSHVDPHIQNLIFTTFEGILMFIVYILYKYGIRSNRVYKKREHATIIGIGGDSGVGKSTLKHTITQLLGVDNIVPIESDGDHKWGRGDQSWETITHLNPKANYLYRQAQYLKALKNGVNIERVEYDHHTGQFTAPKKVYSNDYILVAGLHPFYLPQTRKLIDIKIYLDTQESLRRHWKILRDTELRGYSMDKIMEQITMREVDAQKYIHPQMAYSDLIVRYFTEESFEIGNPSTNPNLHLKLMLKLDVDVEWMVEWFESMGHTIEHVYDADMKYQHIILKEHITKDEIQTVAEGVIENIEEIVNGHTIEWQEGHHGFIQLVLLILLGHHMKKGDEYDI